jgi:hypothetical protein
MGQWHHVAGVYNGSQVVLYVNGVLVKSASRSGLLATNTDALRIGNRQAGDRAYDGAIDEVRVWNRALPLSEIVANRDKELTGTEPGLVAYYRFNEGTGQVGIDAAGQNNNGVRGSTANVENNDPAWISQAPQ